MTVSLLRSRKPRALPAFTIHTAVKQAKKAFDKSSNVRLRTWGPTFTGLAIVPALPYIFDHPVEVVADRAFEWVEHELAKSDKGTQ
jgi:fission process protein 1